MSTLLIQLRPGIPRQRVRMTLEDAQYVMVLDWNERAQRWYFDLYDATNTPLIRTKLLGERADVLRTHRYNPAVPQGILSLMDEQEEGTEATLSSLGVRHNLYYLTSDAS